MKKYIAVLFMMILLAVVLNGCFPGGVSYSADVPAGFFSGIWHGWIAPVSLVFGFFNPNVRIYEPHNTGWFYDLGFYIAIIAGFGGFALIRRSKKE